MFQWGTWSRFDSGVGPEVDRAAGSAEGAWQSPQCWDERLPKTVLLNDESAMRIERCVVRTGPVFAAILRMVYIKRLYPRGRGERDLLHQAHELVAALLNVPACPIAPPERPQGRAADAGAIPAISPEQI